MTPRRRRETTTVVAVNSPCTLGVAVPSVEFVPAFPSVTTTIPDCLRCKQPRDLAGRCSCSFEGKAAGLLPLVALLFAVLGLGAGACSPDMPRQGVELDAGPALDVIFATYGSNAAHPTVWGVPADCTSEHDGAWGFGFWLDGACRGGLTDASGTRIVLMPVLAGTRYSYTLAHEACHWLAGPAGNFDPGHTSACFAHVAAAQAALEAAGAINVVHGAPGPDEAGSVGGLVRAGVQ